MPIYINKNNQQSGPYEEHIVIEQLRNGMLSPDDLGIRHGGTSWQRLGDMFPDTASASQPARLAAMDTPTAVTPIAVTPEPRYRNTGLLKAFFGLCLLVAVVAFAATAYYFYTLMSPSGNLELDLSRLGYRNLARNAAAGILVGGFFAFVAFLLSFKRKIILSNGLRIALRVFFVLVLLVGLGNIVGGAIAYLTYSEPYSSSASESNELLRALDAGAAASGPYEIAAIVLPIGAGLVLLGLSGLFMTKRARD